MNVLQYQQGRSYRGPMPHHCLENLLEDGFIQGKRQENDLELPPTVSSTIAIATAPDGQLFATTHGDHTVKVFEFSTTNCVEVFNGHPRTPWTVKFHPSNADIVASGCLGGQVSLVSLPLCCCIAAVVLPLLYVSCHAILLPCVSSISIRVTN